MSACFRNALAQKKIPKLDALRAISALFVVLYHGGLEYSPAGFGVLCFFVISGFLITWLLLKENAASGTVSLRNFYARRSLRIFPAFYVYWGLVVLLVSIGGGTIIWPQAIASLFYVANYYQGLNHYPSSLLSHTWSLAVEEQFYLLWPAAFVLLRRDPRRLARFLAVMIVCVWLYRVGLHLCGAPEEYIYTAFEARADHLLIGCLLAVCAFNNLFEGAIEYLANGPWLIVPTLAALIASIACAQHWGSGYRNLLGFIVDPLLVTILLIQLVPRKGKAFAWMDHPIVTYVGRISYSTYLYQQMVIPIVTRVLKGHGGPAARVIACVLATWVVAALSYQLVELPFLRLKQRFGSRSPAPADLAAAVEHRPRQGAEASGGS
jgi:peptidoglycan/LPS O-acetylase OafA/YrhL